MDLTRGRITPPGQPRVDMILTGIKPHDDEAVDAVRLADTCPAAGCDGKKADPAPAPACATKGNSWTVLWIILLVVALVIGGCAAARMWT